MPRAFAPATAHLRFQEWVAAGVLLELWRVGLGLELAELGRGPDQIAPGRGKKPAPTPPTEASGGVKRSLLTEA